MSASHGDGFAVKLLSAVVVNIGLRLFTFALSIWLTRSLLPSQAGISFSYQVYIDAILFLSREAVRNVTARLGVRQAPDETDESNTDETTKKNEEEEEASSTSTSTLKEEHHNCVRFHSGALLSLINTAAFAIPLCVLVIVVLEMVAGLLLPGIGLIYHVGGISPLLEVLHALLVGPAAVGGGTAPATALIAQGLGSIGTSWSVLPSLSRRLWFAWGEEVDAALHTLQAGVSSGSRPRTLVLLALRCLGHALPELMVWCCILVMAVVEPCIALLTSLDMFRTVVLAEGVTMLVRLSSTLMLAKLLLWHPTGPGGRETDNHYDGMNTEAEWRVRIVFGCGFMIHAAATLLFYAAACSGPRWCRWLCRTSSLVPPSPPTAQDIREATTLLEANEREDVAAEKKKADNDDAASLIARADEAKGSRSEADHGGTRQRKRPTTYTTGEEEEEELKNIPCAECGRTALLFFPLSFIRVPVMRASARRQHALLSAFFRESAIRLALSEGTNLALLSVSDAASRGCYQTITRLGALLARLVFRIWENACQAYWARRFQAGERSAAVRGLTRMLRISLYVGFAAACLGPLHARQVLTILYSGRWASDGLVAALQYYCSTIGPMAWNGLLECFVRAVAEPDMLRRQQRYTLVISIFFLWSSYMELLHIRLAHNSFDVTNAEAVNGGDGGLWSPLLSLLNVAPLHRVRLFLGSTRTIPSTGTTTAASGGFIPGRSRSERGDETCEDVTVTMALLVVHRYNMLARVAVSLGLLLWPQKKAATPKTRKEKKKDDEEEMEERRGLLTIGDIRRDVWGTAPVLPLALFYAWTRYSPPGYFPQVLGDSILMAPVLFLLLLAVLLAGDREARAAVAERWWRRRRKDKRE